MNKWFIAKQKKMSENSEHEILVQFYILDRFMHFWKFYL